MSETTQRLDFNGLYANPDFQRLEQLLNRFNFFEAADIERLEIKHTKFLSYLLNPNESHGLGSSFLQNFLWVSSAQLADFPDSDDLDLPYAKIQPERLVVKPNLAGKSATKHEKGSLDVFIEIPKRQASDSVIVVVENKINAKESTHTDGSQLERYRKWLGAERDKFDEKIFYLYLTKRGDMPSDKDWWGAINYAEHIVPAIKYTLDQHAGKISLYIEQLLRDYQEIFTDFSDSGEQDECVRKICEVHKWVNDPVHKSQIQKNRGYVKHKSAFDLLMKYSDDKRYDLVKLFKKIGSAAGNVICKHNVILLDDYCLIPGYAMRPRFDFAILRSDLEEAVSTLVDSENKTGIEAKSPIYFQVYFDKDLEDANKYSCRYKLILGPMVDQSQRQSLLGFLLKEFEGEKANRRVGAANWTTISATKVSNNVQDPQSWFEKFCFKPISSDQPDLSTNLAGWVVKSNAALKNLVDAIKQNP